MSINQIKVSEEIPKENSDSNLEKSDLIPKLHIIIPVFNESLAILDLLDRIKNTMKNHYEYLITVIDDGSSDNTYSLLKYSGWKINLIRNICNQGKGKTIEKGFSLANSNEIVVMIDGDGEHPPEEIPKLIDPIIRGKADVVIGSRFLESKLNEFKKGSYLKNRKQFSHFRKFGNKLISIIISLLHHQYITDSQCGFRAFSPGIAQLFKPNYSRFEVETEMTIFYIRKKVKIVEVPIDTGLSTRESHMNIFKDSLKIFLVILDMLAPNGNKIIRIILKKYL